MIYAGFVLDWHSEFVSNLIIALCQACFVANITPKAYLPQQKQEDINEEI